MDNKKRQTYGELNLSHHSNAPLESMNSGKEMIETNSESGDLVEVKVEPGIKEEPQSVSGLVNVSVYNSMGSSVPPLGVNQSTGEYDIVDFDCDDANTEVIEEVDKKKEIDLKTETHSDEDDTENQDNRHQLAQGKEGFLVPEVGQVVMHTKSVENVGGSINGSMKHKCDLCEYSTPYKSTLNRHLLKHTGEKPHECDFCTKRFASKQYLRVHMKIHVEEHMFNCSVCLQGFDEKDEKVTHEMNCKILRYECHLCKESFGSYKQCMMKHMRVHSGDKPFECKECFKLFTQKSDLSKHMKLHAGPQSFRCSKCRQGFLLENKKNEHEEKCNRDVYKCDICGKTFGLYKSHLIQHMRIHTGEKPFQCKICSKKFTQKITIKRHMRIHTKKLQFQFSCLVCRQGFSKDSKRKAHQRNCRGRYYECHLCNKFFGSNKTTLRSHMRTHSGEKPFHCELCQNSFTQKSNLNKHVKNIHH